MEKHGFTHATRRRPAGGRVSAHLPVF
ncbi:hypothetical protein CO2235_50006 [Cupriavidus oxalaticus]|uniref:Uncharacterized protein n=1 Tax=Cupriavidus oxalaticus TaxID=96344 RepID=A0A375G8X7_9BURK|nr:hypothetical protein CO2235_U700013 [Cupriavidus oxalaticus]SPC16719.1 hypothetical protein CO2235_50006 [Cupriavidus oxalaticus]